MSPRQVRRQIADHLDVGGLQLIAQHLDRGRKDRVDIDGSLVLRLLPREWKEGLDDARTAVGGGTEPLCAGAGTFVGGEIAQQCRLTDDDRQWVVQFVRDAGQERAKRGQLFVMVQCLTLARVEAVRRRRKARAAPALPPDTVAIGRFAFDPARRTLTDAGGASVLLTTKEAAVLAVLAVLAAHGGKVVTRETLLDSLPAAGDEPFDRSIDSRIKRLRQKIEADPRKPALIKTVHGSGYMLAGGDRDVRHA